MPNWIETSLHDAILALTRSGESDLAANLGRLLEEPEIRTLRLYRSRRAAELADEIYDCDNLGELSGLLARICSVFSVAHCTIVRIRERQVGSYGPRLLSTYPQSWLLHYVARRYWSVDPVVARALGDPGSFFWEAVARDDPLTAGFLCEAAQYDVGPGGITFAADTSSGDRIAVSLSVPLSHSAFRQSFAEKLSDFEEIAVLLVQVFDELAGASAPDRVVLTDDQMKVLKALASGRDRHEIEALPVSYGSFATLEKSILQAFNARSLVQAVAMAAGRRLLETLPLFEDDIHCSDPCADARPTAA